LHNLQSRHPSFLPSRPKSYKVTSIPDPLDYAHRLAQQANGFLQELYKEFPALQQELQYNFQKYGTPILHEVKGGLWAEDLPKEVSSILEASHYPVEIRIHPSDLDGHHYELEFFVLAYDEQRGRLRRAIDLEKEHRRG
jgi:hypothetical protein